MVINDPLVLTNVVACAAIVLRLMMFRKPGGRHNPWASWLAYLIILAYASVPSGTCSTPTCIPTGQRSPST